MDNIENIYTVSLYWMLYNTKNLATILVAWVLTVDLPESSHDWSIHVWTISASMSEHISIHVWTILSSMSGPVQHIRGLNIHAPLIKNYSPSVVHVILQVILHIHEGSRISEPCTTRGSAQYIKYIKYNYSSHNLNLHTNKTLYFYRIQRSWLA